MLLLRTSLLAALLGNLIASSTPVSADNTIVDQKVIFTIDTGVPGVGVVDIQGDIVGPASTLNSGVLQSSITAYLHGFGHGEYIWDFEAVPGYDFAKAMARLGHVSLVVDRLGYDNSTHPNGFLSSIGLQASLAHGMVIGLKTGTYEVPAGGTLWKFGRVAMVGLSAGGAITEAEAITNRDDLAAIGVFGWADSLEQQGAQRTWAAFSQMGNQCATTGSTGYEYFGQAEKDFQAINFADTEDAVKAAATKLRNPDPCGDASSIAGVADANVAGLRKIDVPVLLMWGTNDATFLPSAPRAQEDLFKASKNPDVTLVLVPNAGHLLPLEREQAEFRGQLDTWLRGHKF